MDSATTETGTRTQPSASAAPHDLQAVLRGKTPEQQKLILKDWQQMMSWLGDGPKAWGGRFWRLTPCQIEQMFGRPIRIRDLTVDDERAIEAHAAHVYRMAAMIGFLLTGVTTAFIVAKLSWRAAVAAAVGGARRSLGPIVIGQPTTVIAAPAGRTFGYVAGLAAVQPRQPVRSSDFTAGVAVTRPWLHDIPNVTGTQLYG